MQARYYALRRFSPYQGMIQVVDAGRARAYSTDGRHWTVRLQGADQHAASGGDDAAADQLMRALNERPRLPFPQQDPIELWLLDKATLLPLALLKTRRRLEEIDAVKTPAWQPFLTTTSGFQCAALETTFTTRRHAPAGSAPPRAQDVLERQVNLVARPRPVLQWFQRLPDGSGIGHDGLRVDSLLRARHLPREAFPELLVADRWPDSTAQALVDSYHAWHAPALLAHQNLSHATRRWLEAAACRNPARLLDNHAMFPEVLDRDAMQVALVSAKLLRAG
ncbi:MAG: hypothetical protein WCY26_00530 [Thiohalobacteraceae bacterium]|nr:hypothetical protein [Gammaproteobacteria bacterium]